MLSETVYYADGTRAGVKTPDDGYWTTRYIGSLIYEGEPGQETLEGVITDAYCIFMQVDPMALEGVNRQNLASIRKSGPEFKNRCTQESVNRQNPASIPKSGLEIKNRCTQEGANRQNLASIPKSGPEIKNRCTLEGVS